MGGIEIGQRLAQAMHADAHDRIVARPQIIGLVKDFRGQLAFLGRMRIVPALGQVVEQIGQPPPASQSAALPHLVRGLFEHRIAIVGAIVGAISGPFPAGLRGMGWRHRFVHPSLSSPMCRGCPSLPHPAPIAYSHLAPR